MPSLRNAVTGVVVSVSEEKVARLGREWQPVDDKPDKPAKPAARGRTRGGGPKVPTYPATEE